MLLAQPSTALVTYLAELLRSVDQLGIEVRDLRSSQSSLEDIFVGLVHSREQSESAASLGGAA